MKPELINEIENNISSIHKIALDRKKFWKRALDTADGDEALASRLLCSAKSRRSEFCIMSSEGLFYQEISAIKRFMALKARADIAGDGESVWKLKYERELEIASCVNDFKYLKIKAESDLQEIKRDLEEDILYGPHNPNIFGLENTIRIWLEFLNTAHGDETKALKLAAPWDWKEIPIEFIYWKLEKELLFGSTVVWRQALLDADGDIKKAATVLKLDGYRYDYISYMLGLKQFADQIRHNRKKPNVRFIVYGLRDPQTNEIRYVGQSKKGLTRPRNLISDNAIAKNTQGCGNWLRELFSLGLKPEIIILEECNTIDSLNENERKHIAEIRAKIGTRLTNITAGGAEKTATYLKRIKDPVYALKTTKGSIKKAAKLLGYTPKQLESRLTSDERLWLKETQANKTIKRLSKCTPS